jgi:hypothetical protein
MNCPRHPAEIMDWYLVDESRRKYGCPICLGIKGKGEHPANQFPLVKYSQTWYRDRPLTTKEKKHPPRRPT